MISFGRIARSTGIQRWAFTRSSNISQPFHIYGSAISATRTYAKKASNKKAYTSPFPEEDAPVTVRTGRKGQIQELVPGSKHTMGDELRQDWEKCNKKMTAAVEYFRKEAGSLEAQGSGRVMPSLLDPVRVALPGSEGMVKLADVATVGVREGSTLVVSVFDEENLKHVEKAIYAARLPHIVPQKADSRTLRIPVPRPTVEALAVLVASISKLAEETRIQVRKAHQIGMKDIKAKGEHPKSKAGEEIQALTNKHIGEIDKILKRIKTELTS